MNKVDRGLRLLSTVLQGFQSSVRKRKSRTCVSAAEVLEYRQLLAATGLQVVHRSGQSFVTWQEDTNVTGEGYHVYRSTSPITTGNVAQAQKLTSKWGPLDDNTSHHPLTGVGAPANFVVQDFGTALSDDTGLFVYTIQAGEAGNWYYAVTEVIGGNENLTLTSGSNSLASPVSDTVAAPQPVLVSTINGGNGRVYTQYMDYANWNPTFEGYAYNYSVALPVNYDPNVAWPMRLMLHAYGERYRLESNADFGWPVIEVFPDDGGAQSGFRNTWWYGFAADHNYNTNGLIPTSGHIENFTEQRLFQMMDQVKANFNVDDNAVHIQGHSMGASGALSLGIRYGDYFAWTFSSEPMTNYGTNPTFQNEFTQIWGSQASNLPIVNKGPYASRLVKYNNTSVYTWMNHQAMLPVMRNEPMAMLMVGHGKIDDVIDWQTQGQPIIAALNNAHVAFTAEQRNNWDHTWMGFDYENTAMFGVPNVNRTDWIFRKDSSLIAFSNASGSGPLTPPPTGTNFYNLELDWSVPWNNFGAAIVDTTTQYQVTLRSRAGVQTADVTPQKTAAFKATPGAVVTWQNINVSNSQVLQSGSVTADAAGLVTIPSLQILTGSGNRLTLNMTLSLNTPVILTPIGATDSQTPTLTWTASSGAALYDLWVKNLSTGQNPVIQSTPAGTIFISNTPMGIGQYRVWVRARTAAGVTSAWSAPKDFQITSPVVINNLAPSFTSAPSIAWPALPGAAKYDLWLNNASTGQQQVVRNSNITATSYQLPGNLPLGKYTVWVRGLDAGNNQANWSTFKQFDIAPGTAIVSPASPSFNNQPTFQWQAVAGATRYELFVRNLVTNAITLNPANLTGTSFTPSSAMPVSDYRWWVRASNNAGVVGTWSQPLDFNVGGKPTVLTPTGTTSDRTPTFSWTPVQGATRYELWVQKRDGSGVVINLTNITTNSYMPSSNMAPYDYRVWVRAVTSSNVFSYWSALADFTVTEITSPFERISPEHLSAILVSALSHSDRPVAVELGKRILAETESDDQAACDAMANERVFDRKIVDRKILETL